jgi:tetratricopeptide (TPR) repeat protein
MHPELLNNPTFVRYYEAWQQNQGSLVFAPLADFLCQYKLFAEARKVCEAGVKNNPNSVLAHYSLAKTYTYTREWHSARHEAQWVLARVNDHEGALDVLQKVEQNQIPMKQLLVRPEPIVAAIEAAGGSTPVIPTVLPDSGKSQRESSSDKQSLAPRSKVNPTAGVTAKKVPWQTVTMAKIYAQQGHYFKARTIYKTILSREPQNAEAQAGLATLEQKMRDSANA